MPFYLPIKYAQKSLVRDPLQRILECSAPLIAQIPKFN